jgi:hypothetical protein
MYKIRCKNKLQVKKAGLPGWRNSSDFRAAKIDLLRRQLIYIERSVADVAELADALDSKSSIREDVWVRPPPSAPPFAKDFIAVLLSRQVPAF